MRGPGLWWTAEYMSVWPDLQIWGEKLKNPYISLQFSNFKCLVVDITSKKKMLGKPDNIHHWVHPGPWPKVRSSDLCKFKPTSGSALSTTGLLWLTFSKKATWGS